MNQEGIRTPTEDAAVARETRREKLRKKYHIKEGDVVQMEIDAPKGLASEAETKVISKVRIKEIHECFVTIIRPSGLLESYQWWDFTRRKK